MRTVRRDSFSVETVLAREGDEYFLFVGTKEGWSLRATVQPNGTRRRIEVYDRNADRVGHSESSLATEEAVAVRDALHFHLLRY